jgi:DNA-binding phage protein
MTTSAKTWSMSVNSNNVNWSKAEFAYFQARLKNRIHDIVVNHYLHLQKEEGLTKAELARRLKTRPEQITRWLSAPGNWQLDTVSNLLLAMQAEPDFSISKLADRRFNNFSHELAVSSQTAGPNPTTSVEPDDSVPLEPATKTLASTTQEIEFDRLQ